MLVKILKGVFKYENWCCRADNTDLDENKKEQFQNIVKEHYEKAFEEWKNKNYIPIISMKQTKISTYPIFIISFTIFII